MNVHVGLQANAQVPLFQTCGN